jgi:hypothetical protein
MSSTRMKMIFGGLAARLTAGRAREKRQASTRSADAAAGMGTWDFISARLRREMPGAKEKEHQARKTGWNYPGTIWRYRGWIRMEMREPAPNTHDMAPPAARGADSRIWVAKLKRKHEP